MQDARLRVALVGYGIGGAVFHAPLISATPTMVLSGRCHCRPGATSPGLGPVSRQPADVVTGRDLG